MSVLSISTPILVITGNDSWISPGIVKPNVLFATQCHLLKEMEYDSGEFDVTYI